MAKTALHLYGLRPAKLAPSLYLSRLLNPITIPPAVDYVVPLPAWAMLGNDAWGCCVATAWANARRLLSAHAGAEVYPGLPEVLTLYQTQNPTFDPNGDPATVGPGSSADGGMDIQTCLEYLHSTGGPDGVHAVAFARVNTGNEAEVRAAIAIFGYVWVGLQISQANENAYSAPGVPVWTHVASSPILGGHSVIVGGYVTRKRRKPALLDRLAQLFSRRGSFSKVGYRAISWAEEADLTESFWRDQVSDAWVCIWPEHLTNPAFLTGIDLAALQADYLSLTGNVLSV